MSYFKLFIYSLILFIPFACSEQMEEKESIQSDYQYVVGTWQLKDIVFLTPSSDPLVQEKMEAGKTNILKQSVKMTFKADNSAIENVNGQFQTGKWKVQKDSIMSVQYAQQKNPNYMILRSYNDQQLQFAIGTQNDMSLYVFKRVSD